MIMEPEASLEYLHGYHAQRGAEPDQCYDGRAGLSIAKHYKREENQSGGGSLWESVGVSCRGRVVVIGKNVSQNILKIATRRHFQKRDK